MTTTEQAAIVSPIERPPHVAAVVQYVQFAGADRRENLAAIVTGFPQHDQTPGHVNLVVFAATGFFFAHNVPHDPLGADDGTWKWPEQPTVDVPDWLPFTPPNNVDLDVGSGKPKQPPTDSSGVSPSPSGAK